MRKIKLYLTEKYFDVEPHLDASGKKEYFLDETIKPKWVYEALSNLNLPVHLVEPEKLSWNDLLLAHSEEYITAVFRGKPEALASSSGLQWGKKLFRSQLYTNGGVYSASRTALEEGVSGTLSGGFHHASRNSGAGFCVFNGIAIAIKKLQNKGLIEKALVFDCDVHFGDGTLDIFADDDTVFIVDLFRSVRYKGQLPPPLTRSGVFIKTHNAKTYFEEIQRLPLHLKKFKPDLVIYNAGMDAYEGDRLGGISGVSETTLKERDSFVFKTCKELGVPVAFALEGAYAKYKDKKGRLLSKEKVEEGRKKIAELYVSLVKNVITTFCV